MTRLLEFTLNGRDRADAVADNILLLDFLREQVGLTGTKTGCDGGETRVWATRDKNDPDKIHGAAIPSEVIARFG